MSFSITSNEHLHVRVNLDLGVNKDVSDWEWERCCLYNIRSNSLRLVLYQVRDFCGIKSGHCVVSSTIYVLIYWGGMPIPWSYVVSRLESCVVSRLVLCCIKTVDLCYIKSMILIDGTLWEWISNYGDGLVLYQVMLLYYVIYC